MDNSYPSPMTEQSKYVGKLNERRKHDAPPFPSTFEFVLEGLSSNTYEAEYAEWTERQLALDNEGFILLAKHYGLAIEDDDFYKKVALSLARNHVPAFRMKNPGKQKEWTNGKLRLLVLRVYIKMKEGLSRADAIKELSKSGEIYEFEGAREGLRNRVGEGEKLLDLEKLDMCTIEKVKEFEKAQTELVRRTGEEIKRWYG